MAVSVLSVCFLTQAFPDFQGAYRGIFVENLARCLVSQGYQIVVVTPRIYKVSEKYEERGKLHVYRFFFPSGERPLITYGRIPVFRMIIYMVSCFLRTLNVIKRYHCRLLHIHWIHPNGIVGVVAKAILRIPFVVHVRGSDLNIFALKNHFFKYLTRMVLRHSDMIICTSKATKVKMTVAFPKILKHKKAIVVYNEIDAATFHPMPEQEARKKLGIQADGLHFLFIGNLVIEKGVLELVNLMMTLSGAQKGSNVFLHIVGAGPLEQLLRKKVDENGQNSKIFIHGPVDPRQIPFWLNASNVLILPSEREGMPNVILEAVHCGIPVLATDVGDVGRFITENVNGFIMGVGDKRDELRQHLLRFMANHDELISMKKRLQNEVNSRGVNEGGCKGVAEIYDALMSVEEGVSHA